MGEADQFVVPAQNGSLSLEPPEKCALRWCRFAFEKRQQIDAIVGAVLPGSSPVVAFVFVGEWRAQCEGRAFGGG